jgi:hypothetical protein
VTIELSWATAEAIAGDLDAARSRLDGTAGSAPGSVDAGDATALITQMVATVTQSAAGLSEGLGAAGRKVLSSASSLMNADDAAQQTFRSSGER